MNNIHKTLYLMAKRDQDTLNEGSKEKVGTQGTILPPPGTPAETAPGTLVQTTPKPPTVAPPVYADKEIREMVMQLQCYLTAEC